MKIKRIALQDAVNIRHKVLWPDKEPSYCIVEGDDDAWHFGVIFDNRLVCVGSIYIEATIARLRKFATLHEYQGLGVGSFMLNYLIRELKNRDISHFWLDARETAVGFYQRFDFSVSGERFFKSEIGYFKMILHL